MTERCAIILVSIFVFFALSMFVVEKYSQLQEYKTMSAAGYEQVESPTSPREILWKKH